MDRESLFASLREYIGWKSDDELAVRACYPLVAHSFEAIIEDFYRELLRHEETRSIITGGEAQLERLKQSLRIWLVELFQGPYDAEYCHRRWRVGYRHVELGLRQTFVNAAIGRIRSGLNEALRENWEGTSAALCSSIAAFNRLLDLDLAIIEDAYHAEFSRKLQASERQAATGEMAASVAMIGRLALESQNVSTFLNAVCRHTSEQLRTAVCAALEATPDGRGLIVKAAQGWNGMNAGDMVVCAETHSLPCQAWKSGKMVAGNLDVTFGDRQLVGLEEMASGFAVPIQSPHGVYGVLVGYCRQPRDFSPSEINFLQALSNMLSAALGRIESEMRSRQSERLAAIGQMAAGLAHESRNALQRSQACLEMLALKIENSPEILELVERAQKAQDHVHRLFEEVRGYAAPIHLSRQVCDLRLLWREVWDDLRSRHEPRRLTLQELGLEISTVCSVDGHALSQVIRNIFENAIDASPEGGTITVACRMARSDPQSLLQLSIRDQGKGLNAEQRLKIFEPFFTTKTHGTGLGMAIARRIVEAHDGRLELGQPESGAELNILLKQNVR